jgi:hypothetical protein
MKKIVSLFVFAATLFCFSLEAKQACPQKLHRFYVQSSDIKILQNGMYVSLDGAWIPIEQISQDSEGISISGVLVQKSLTECRECGYVYYTRKHPSKCPQCGRTNN